MWMQMKGCSFVLSRSGCGRFSLREFGVGTQCTANRILQDLEWKESEQEKKALPSRSWNKIDKWKSKHQLVDQLVKSVVYYQPELDKSGLLVLNKPHGLPAKPAKDTPFSLSGCLEDLAASFAVDKIEILKSCDRYCSGITVLATKSETARQVQKSKGRAAQNRQLTSSYLAITKGHVPKDHKEFDEFYTSFKECTQIENPTFSKIQKEPIISRYLPSSKNKFNQLGARFVQVHSKRIANSAKVQLGLLNISPSTVKNHLLSIWLADQLLPMLGDHMYDYRVRTVMGKKVKRGPEFSQLNQVQLLDDSTRSLLGISRGDELRVPKFVHLWRLHLPGWYGKDKHLTVFAPPPQHFIQLLKAADIEFNFDTLMNEDQVYEYSADGMASTYKKKKKTKEANSRQPENEEDVIVIK